MSGLGIPESTQGLHARTRSTIAATLWIGGIFFALIALRPAGYYQLFSDSEGLLRSPTGTIG